MTMILKSAWATMGLLILLAVMVLGASMPQAHGETTVPLPLPHVLLEHTDGRVHLSGTVPDEAERMALEQHVRSRYAGLPLHSRLQVGVVGNPSWLSAAYLPDLRGASRATVVLADALLRVDAEVPSAAMRERLQASTAAARAAGLQVTGHVELR